MPTRINRRAILAGAATATVTPAIAAPFDGPDPIFAAIEEYRTTQAAFLARCRHEDDLAEKGTKLKPAVGDHRTPEMAALVDAVITARSSLANTAATTPAGLAAYLDFVLAASIEGEEFLFVEDEGEKSEILDFVRALARAVHGMAGRA